MVIVELVDGVGVAGGGGGGDDGGGSGRGCVCGGCWC